MCPVVHVVQILRYIRDFIRPCLNAPVISINYLKSINNISSMTSNKGRDILLHIPLVSFKLQAMKCTSGDHHTLEFQLADKLTQEQNLAPAALALGNAK